MTIPIMLEPNLSLSEATAVTAILRAAPDLTGDPGTFEFFAECAYFRFVTRKKEELHRILVVEERLRGEPRCMSLHRQAAAWHGTAATTYTTVLMQPSFHSRKMQSIQQLKWIPGNPREQCSIHRRTELVCRGISDR